LPYSALRSCAALQAGTNALFPFGDLIVEFASLNSADQRF